MSWGVPRRPKISTRLGNPNPREGSDGDIQIKGTALGAKLWGKWSGRWWDIPLSRDGVTKFGVTDSNYLSIDRDSVDIFTNKVKVASFGATTTVGNFSATSAGVVTVSQIQCSGKIKVGKPDGTFNSTDNIAIGQANSELGLQNVSIGYQTGEDLTGTGVGASLANVLIGYNAGKEVTGAGSYNVCVGSTAGNTITTGTYNICIGEQSDSSSATGTERIAIGRGVICDGNEQIRIGDSGDYLLFDFNGEGETVVTSDKRVKKNIEDTDLGLNFINALKPIKYTAINKYDYPDELFQEGVNTYKNGIERKPDPTKRLEGFIAQDVKQVMDDLNVAFSGWRENESSRQMLSYSSFVVPLTKAVQELSAKLDTMQTEINSLKAE